MDKNFKLSTNAWKAEPDNDLCRCCHSEGSFKSINATYFWMDVEEVVYSNMLKECFDIEMISVSESAQQIQMLCAICYTCIQRLEDAVRFKRQVQKCERRFQDIYIECVTKDHPYEVAVKEEIMEPEEKNTTYSTASQNGKTNFTSIVKPAIVNDDDDDICRQDDLDYKVESEEDLPLQRIKTCRKPKKTKKPSAKVRKKKDLESNTKQVKTSKCVKDEKILETLEGVIKVVKRLIVKRDVDYKQTDNILQCLKCPYVSKAPHGMRDHIRSIHMNIPKHSCPTCNKAFSTLATFTKHKLEEHNIDHRFKCNACENAFNTKAQLKRHINTYHMLGVKIKCKECDYETFSVESLYKHKFKHKTVKDYHCKYCRKAFVRKTTLQLHERIHTGDRRKVCSVCGQAFVQKASLNYHMTKYHPEVAF